MSGGVPFSEYTAGIYAGGDESGLQNYPRAQTRAPLPSWLLGVGGLLVAAYLVHRMGRKRR